jgi:hypothetical protein
MGKSGMSSSRWKECMVVGRQRSDREAIGSITGLVVINWSTAWNVLWQEDCVKWTHRLMMSGGQRIKLKTENAARKQLKFHCEGFTSYFRYSLYKHMSTTSLIWGGSTSLSKRALNLLRRTAAASPHIPMHRTPTQLTGVATRGRYRSRSKSSRNLTPESIPDL